MSARESTHHVDAEITTFAVRALDDRAVVALGTADGTSWWIDLVDASQYSTATDVDLPTGIAIHPHRDEVTLTGPRGYAVWRPGYGVEQHLGRGWGSAAAYAHGGDLAVAVGRTVRIHADAEGSEPYVSAPAPSTVTDVAWTPQGNRVAASAYGGVYVHDGRAAEPVRVYPYLGSHLAVAVNPNRRWVCSGNQDASVHIWRTSDGEELQMTGFPQKVTRLAFDDTGRWMANNGAEEVAVWDFIGQGPGGRNALMLPGHSRVVDLDWRPGQGGRLVTVGAEGGVRLWNLTGAKAGQRRRIAGRALAFDDALGARWLGTDRVVVTRADGVVSVVGIS
ncbi:WD40 repeat domain-containing protein [Propionibacteriaceae bacterium G1746]